MVLFVEIVARVTEISFSFSKNWSEENVCNVARLLTEVGVYFLKSPLFLSVSDMLWPVLF